MHARSSRLAQPRRTLCPSLVSSPLWIFVPVSWRSSQPPSSTASTTSAGATDHPPRNTRGGRPRRQHPGVPGARSMRSAARSRERCCRVSKESFWGVINVTDGGIWLRPPTPKSRDTPERRSCARDELPRGRVGAGIARPSTPLTEPVNHFGPLGGRTSFSPDDPVRTHALGELEHMREHLGLLRRRRRAPSVGHEFPARRLGSLELG
jgi:hypothetical protein